MAGSLKRVSKNNAVRPKNNALRIAGFLIFMALTGFAANARACCCASCIPAVIAASARVQALIRSEHSTTRDQVTDEFEDWRTWLLDDYFRRDILPALMQATNQMSAVGMYQMMIIGTFLDAKHQLETQRLYQEMAAQTHHDYQPSEGLCTIGSNIKSLAASEASGNVTAITLGQRSLDRQLLNVNAGSAPGPDADRKVRSDHFRRVYCEKNDNNRDLAAICSTAPAPSQIRKNKDIDFVRTIAMPATLDIDFSNSTMTPDEEDVLALQSNLYSQDLFLQTPAAKLRSDPEIQKLYMDTRSIVAKRSIAEQSFQAIAGMKSRGTVSGAETAKYMKAVLGELGIPAAEAQSAVGDNPSYWAQMEVLTKKIFQRPEFFVDLYDNPANVARKKVALQAISLMQRRDLFQSSLRTEAILSAIIELEVMDAQTKVQDSAGPMTEKK
ncbi:MAG TPA: hypothetical protein VIF12_06950 [Micavibrio sp.]